MELFVLFMLSVGLAMDAFAVSISDGICCHRMGWRESLGVALTFGAFQAAMPLIGFFAGKTVSGAVEAVDHWIALGLLTLIGGNMIREGVKGLRHPEQTEHKEKFLFRELMVQGIATSIDALAVGISLAMTRTNIWLSVLMIGVITFLISLAGVGIGKKFGAALREKAQILGGLILITIGIKIVIEHLIG